MNPKLWRLTFRAAICCGGRFRKTLWLSCWAPCGGQRCQACTFIGLKHCPKGRTTIAHTDGWLTENVHSEGPRWTVKTLAVRLKLPTQQQVLFRTAHALGRCSWFGLSLLAEMRCPYRASEGPQGYRHYRSLVAVSERRVLLVGNANAELNDLDVNQHPTPIGYLGISLEGDS
jgi:hypothetical protein